MVLKALLRFALAAVTVVEAVAGGTATYRLAREGPVRASTVVSFQLAVEGDWIHLSAEKANGARFELWIQSAGYPASDREQARKQVRRYILREGDGVPREYRNLLTGEAVLPSVGGWEYLLPRPRAEDFPETLRLLGHGYVRRSFAGSVRVGPPERTRVVTLRPDLLVGPAHNFRTRDDRRRWDDSDYEYVRLTRADYREMAEAGITCVMADGEQVEWAEELGLFYWGPGKNLPYPELLYRSQYLGPTIFLDEPAVGTRDHVLRPRLAQEPAFRKAITPQLAFEAFREYYAGTLREGPPVRLMKMLAERPDVDLGDMHFTQQNLFSWETMIATAAWQLSRDPKVPAAIVFEPPGRIGTRRTVPEMDMSYGVSMRPDDPLSLISIIVGFLRGAARLTGKGWGVSIYGAVQRDDAPFWLTYAYDRGATHFFFWDNARLACVPYGEYLALARHLKRHTESHPRRDLEKLRTAAEVLILLPAGYNLGHVRMGRGQLWGLDELNLERRNWSGVSYRKVMHNFFAEIERAQRLGISFDLGWDLPGIPVWGYREIVRVREDGKVEIGSGGRTNVLEGPRQAERPGGLPPRLEVSLTAREEAASLAVTAIAKVVETTAPVYYTHGADPEGVYHNAMVAWELYGPGEEDYRFLAPEGLRPAVHRTEEGALVEMGFRIERPGRYRLRASTVDEAGRSTVVWKELAVSRDAMSGALRLAVLR